MKKLSLLMLVLAGCATVEAERRSAGTAAPATADWVPMMSVPSRGDPASAIDRARARLGAQGFETNLAALIGEAPASHELLLSDDRRDPGRCFGTTEVIAVNARKAGPGTSLLHFACVTARWREPAKAGDSCEHTQVLGCPLRGDRALAEMAAAAALSL